jgi:hypothetical protein
MAMTEIEQQYFDFAAPAAFSAIDQHGQVADGSIGNVRDLPHSSPRPWILAIGISLSMWACLAWLISIAMR